MVWQCSWETGSWETGSWETDVSNDDVAQHVVVHGQPRPRAVHDAREMSSGCAAAQDREHIVPERPCHSTRRLFLTLHVQTSRCLSLVLVLVLSRSIAWLLHNPHMHLASRDDGERHERHEQDGPASPLHTLIPRCSFDALVLSK